MKLDRGQWVMVGLLGLVLLIVVSGLGQSDEPSSVSDLSIDAAADVSDPVYSSSNVSAPTPAAPGRVDDTLLPQERAQWQSDPESYGWSDEDRQFFEEHGVSEAEARAAETILREQGVD